LTFLSAVLGTAGWAQDEKKPEIPEALVRFVVIRDYNGKPIRNAGVVMHAVDGKGRQERGDLELKTDVDGRASFDGIPYGKLRVQVLAQGFQTFGEDYDVAQPSLEITVKLKRPKSQYSIYDDHSGQNGTDTNKTAPDATTKPN
jgi:hypothetical protein